MYRVPVFAVLILALVGCPGPDVVPRPVREVTMPVFTEEELAAAEELKVVMASPKGDVEYRSEADEVSVTFDAPMIALEEVPDTVDFPLLIEPDAYGTCHWQGTRTIVFRPDTTLPPATEFKVTVPRGVRAVGGEMVKQEYSFEFSTWRPRLSNSTPHEGQRLVELRNPLYLEFNMPMDPRRARKDIHLVRGDGTEERIRVRSVRRQDEPEGWWYYYPDDSASTLVVEPVRGMRIQTHYELVLDKGLLGRVGSRGTDKQRTVSFKTFNRFKFKGVSSSVEHHPEDALVFEFTNPVPIRELARRLRFEPEVEIPDEYQYREYSTDRVYLYLALEPETTYRVTVSRWLKDRFGNRLGRDAKFELRTVSYRPSMSMPTGRGIVESDGKLLHPVRMVNVDSLMVRMRRLDRAEVIPFWMATYDRYRYYDNGGGKGRSYDSPGFYTNVRKWFPELAWNKRTTLPMRLEPGLDGRRSGFLFCELDMFFDPYYGTRYRRAFLQVTPYGITAKFSPENSFAYVTRLADASAVGSVGIQVRDDENRILWRGRTNEHGFVLFPGWDDLGVRSKDDWRSPRVWVFADTDAGQAFVHSEWGTGISPWEFGIPYDWSPEPDRPKAFVFTEKGLYKAGDTVRIKGMVRAKKLGRWVVPSERDGRLWVTDSRGDEVIDEPVRLSGRGSFDITIPLADDAPSGYYSVEYELGELDHYSSFRVEAYRPAEFEVLVKATKDEYFAGDAFDALVTGRYLFGAPMAEDRVRWSVSLSPSYYSPPGYQGYNWSVYMDDNAESYRELASGEGKLGPEGQTRVQAKLDLGRGFSTCRVNCEATVTAENERSIAGRESYLVHRGEVYVGVKVEESFLEVGDSLGFDVVAARPDGGKVKGQGVNVTVYRREWKSARKAQTGGRYSWVSEKLDTKVTGMKLKTGDEPMRRWFKPDRPGYYWLKCETRDRRRNNIRSDRSFWVAGKGSAAWQMRDDDMIELVRDRESYKPGDTARVLVKSPWTNVQALVTVEREFVIDYFTAGLEGNAELVRIPIKEEYLPNVFVSVVLLKGRTAKNEFGDKGEDLGKPGFKVGYVELPVDPEARKLTVEVTPDRKQYEPGDSVVLDIEVGGRDGAVDAEVSVAVVDLGVLKLTGFATPNPFSYFYSKRSLSVATVESRLHVIGQRNYGEKGEAAGGDGWAEENGRFGAKKGNGDYEFSYREKFLETALWLPSVHTGQDGRAEVVFELPDNLTTWKIMAVAADRERFGSGDAQFRANRPVLLMPSLPRFMRPDDEFKAGVMVHNRTEEKLEIKVRAKVQGGVELSTEESRSVTIPANEATEVLFEYTCTGGHEGKGTFVFEASAGGHRDALKLELPVRDPPVTEAVALYEQMTDSMAVQWVKAPADVFSGVGGLEMTVASSGLSGLERGVEYLRTYPYDCLEQRLSKILPFIVGEELINQFKLSTLTGSELREFVKGELALVSGYQDASGGFYFWANSAHWWKPSPYLSAYCMYALARADQAGYVVDPGVVALGKSYLHNWLGYSEDDHDWPYSVNERLTTRALAVYALALWGEKPTSYVNRLMEDMDQLSVFGKANLLKAVHLMGMGDETEARIVEAVNNKIKLTPTTAHYEEDSRGGWIFHSNVRTTAVVLQALLDARGEVEFAEKVVKWLVTERKAGRWRTTQENIYVFDAFTTFYRVYEKVEPDFVVTLKLAGTLVLQEAFRGRELETRRDFIGIDDLAGGERQQVDISKDGPGRLYYGLRLSYAPKGRLEPRYEGFTVEKTIRPAKGRGTGYSRGQQYLVTLKVETNQDRLYVVVDDPLPAGFEIVNTSFATESRKSGDVLYEARKEDRGSRWWGGFNHEEQYDDRYLLFATSLNAGTHTKTYLVKALTPGEFHMPPTKVEEMYTPEVFGRTGQSRISVK